MGVFNHIEDAMNAVYKTMSSGVTPVAMEFLDNLSIKAVEERFSKGLPKDAGAILITQVDGVVKEQIVWQLNEIEKHFKANCCVDFKIAQNEQEEQDLWFSRRNASQSISVYGKKEIE